MSEVVLILGMAKHIPDSLKSMDMIGVDHGALLCVQNHVKMVGAIGDFDSVSKQEYEWISSESEVVRLPEKKNETDHIRAVSRGNDLLWSRIPFDCLCCGDRSKGKEAPGI